MRRLFVLATVLYCSSLGLGGTAPALAQDATPVAPTSAAVPFGPLVGAFEADVAPPGPWFLVLGRFTYAPGTASPAGPDPGPTLIVVESGTLTVTLDGPAAPTTGPAATSPAPSEGEHQVPTGSGLAIPPTTGYMNSNAGPEPVVALLLTAFPFDPFAEAMGGMGALPPAEVEQLLVAQVPSLPTGPFTLGLERVAPGDRAILPAPPEVGVRMVLPEAGPGRAGRLGDPMMTLLIATVASSSAASSPGAATPATS